MINLTKHFLGKQIINDKSWEFLPWIMIIGFLLRIFIIFVSEANFDSDEIFQYLEQAHRLTFGYGIIPWEYAHGIRNWFLSCLIALVLSACRLFGLDQPEIYIPIVQILACIISLSAIYCTYWIGRQVAGENVGRIASILSCIWYEMVILAHKITPEIFSTYLLLGALTCILRKPSNRSALMLGLFCGGAIILRLQYAPVVMLMMGILLLFWKQEKWLSHQIAIAITGSLIIIFLVGWLDYYTWGSFFISFYNNYLYNAVYGVSKLFGENPFWQYFTDLGLYSAGLFLFGIFYGLFRKKKKPWLLLILLCSILVPHSFISHKEYRFIFLAVPICLLLIAIAINDLLSAKKLWNKYNPGKLLAQISVTLSLIGFTIILVFFGTDNSLYAYLYLNNQPKVISVLNLNSDWYRSGGYYYLHKNLPVYFRQHIDQAGISMNNLSKYVSHIVCKTDLETIPNFTVIAKFDSVEVRASNTTPSETINIQTYRYFQDGIDGKFKPTVTPRIWLKPKT